MEIEIRETDLHENDRSRKAEDRTQILDFALSWVAILADSPLNEVNGYKPRRQYNALLRALMLEGAHALILRFSDLAYRLIDSCDYATLVYDERVGSTTFAYIPEFQDTPVFKEYQRFRQTEDPELLEYLLTFLLFGRKLEVEDEEFYANALSDWRRVEEHLSNISFPSRILDDVKNVIQWLIPEPTVRPIVPMGRHGPGSTAEGVRGRLRKNHYFRWPAKLERFFTGQYARTLGGDSLLDVMYDATQDSKVKIGTLDGNASRLMFVPKDIRKARTICMEPIAYMYAQQTFRHILEETMSARMRRWVDIKDQSRNRDLARFGSREGSVDTLDLSSASDTVHIDLVRAVTPRWLKYHLLATRTSSVELPNGEVVDVNKFAPMGSALCFPVQSLLYTAIVIVAHAYTAMEHGLEVAVPHTPSAWGGFIERRMPSDEAGVSDPRPEIFEPMSVYGDDIVCDTRCSRQVLRLLTALGFFVNQEKSYRGSSRFRESCGGWFFDGYEVTPFLYRVKRHGRAWDPDGLFSCVAASNAAGDAGYQLASRYLRRMARWIPVKGTPWYIRKVEIGNPIAFTNNAEIKTAFYTVSPAGNRHLGRRVSGRYQRSEVKCLQPRERTRTKYEDALSTLYRKAQWWRAVSRSGNDDDALQRRQSSYDSRGVRAARVWTPIRQLAAC